jgi:hypothetical protein
MMVLNQLRRRVRRSHEADEAAANKDVPALRHLLYYPDQAPGVIEYAAPSSLSHVPSSLPKPRECGMGAPGPTPARGGSFRRSDPPRVCDFAWKFAVADRLRLREVRATRFAQTVICVDEHLKKMPPRDVGEVLNDRRGFLLSGHGSISIVAPFILPQPDFKNSLRRSGFIIQVVDLIHCSVPCAGSAASEPSKASAQNISAAWSSTRCMCWQSSHQ